MQNGEVFDFLTKCEKSVHLFCIKELKKTFDEDANRNLLQKFGELFKNDEAGSRRDWRKIDEKDIKSFFSES